MDGMTLRLDPCHKCGEDRIGAGKLMTELHPGTAYVVCTSCDHVGPQRLPRGDMSVTEDRLKVLKAVVDAWNAEQRAHGGGPSVNLLRPDPPTGG